MFESIALTEQQLDIMERGTADWLPMTPEQHDLVRTCGPERSCALVGDAFVRMPMDHFERMLGAGFKAAAHSAIKKLGLIRADEIADISMDEYVFGSRHLSATVTSADGRKATGLGELVLPSVAN